MKPSKSKKQITPKTLRALTKSGALSKQAQRELRAFTKQLLASCNYWILAQYRKKERGAVKGLSFALRVKLSELLEQWQKKANGYSKDFALKYQKAVESHIDSAFLRQGKQYGIKNKSASKITEARRASLYEQTALIKTIPQEIIRRYEGSLYKSIDSFDLGAIQKRLRQISEVSIRRTEIIARDQISKAMESYHSARSQELGLEYYVWQTAGDERVSDGKGGHRALNGRIYRYDTPTAIIDSYGNRGHTSERPLCRCLAAPLLLEPNQSLRLVRDATHGDYYEIVEK